MVEPTREDVVKAARASLALERLLAEHYDPAALVGRQVVVVEGIVVGLMSWVLAVLLSAPVGLILAGAVIQAVLKAQTNFQYSTIGVLIWLAIVVIIGILSSLGPARNAVRLSVREVLDYECFLRTHGDGHSCER